jgi:hypothetical protein
MKKVIEKVLTSKAARGSALMMTVMVASSEVIGAPWH